MVEAKTHLNSATKRKLLKEIKKLQTGDTSERLTSNNKSLKLYLCAKYNVGPVEEIAVHHINLDYNDYRPVNIALVYSSEHSKAHVKALTGAINSVLSLRNITNKAIHNLRIEDLSEDEIRLIYEIYFNAMQEWLNTGGNIIHNLV